MNDIGQIISRLEQQRAAIDRAITALREIEGPAKGSISAHAATPTVHRKSSANRQSSPKASSESSAKGEEPKRGHLTAAGRKKLALAAKRRWALAKRKGMNAVTGKPLGKVT